MASVINTNIAATRTHNVYNRNNEFMNAAMTRVATGMKINSAKDGASTWAISEKMRERIRANDQANQNVQNDTALLKTAQGGVSNTIDILKTLKERAINAGNDSNMNADRDRIAVEVQELLTQINDNAGKVKFNGRTLLDGTGAKDEASKFKPTDSSSSSSAASGVKAPEAATVGSDKGSNAVYQLKFSAFGASADKDTKLTTLTDLGFTAGDKITFSWKEDGGDTQSKVITIDDNTTTSALAFTETNLKVTSVEAAGDIEYTSGTAVTKADGTNLVATASDLGLYAVGKDGVAITDFKVAVTYDDNGTEKTRTAAQTALKFTGLEQARGEITGDHSVFGYSGEIYDSDSSAVATTSTALKYIKVGGSSGTDLTTAGNSDNLTFKVGSESVTLAGNKTIDDLTTAMAAKGIKVVLDNTGSTALTDAAGKAVTDSDGEAFKTPGKGLYFVGKNGEALTFSVSADNSKTVTAPTEIMKYKAASDGSGGSGGSGKTTDLTFYIGGETGFGITASISSMKVEDLFEGKDVGTVATMFTDSSQTDSLITLIDNALDTALNEQTKLGAMESRLGYTSDNLVTMNENLEAADSVMRDSDIAKEMTSYMKYAVLSQASQYMLAQAGQNAFQVLNLLQQ